MTDQPPPLGQGQGQGQEQEQPPEHVEVREGSTEFEILDAASRILGRGKSPGTGTAERWAVDLAGRLVLNRVRLGRAVRVLLLPTREACEEAGKAEIASIAIDTLNGDPPRPMGAPTPWVSSISAMPFKP